MGTIKYTKEQLRVIETRDKNILVSAAAGSGKTTVLVQRIINKVLDTEKMTDIDKILVLTFTDAAAGQMREKIEEAINRSIEVNPGNEHLVKQAVLIHNAQISTIHSFCLNLVRNNFTDIDIDPAFRVAETGEIKLVAGEVADELIDDLFEEKLVSDFELLADRFTSKNSIEGLKTLILNAYDVCQNAPFVTDYIEERRHDYDCSAIDELDAYPWGKELLEYTRIQLKAAFQLAKYNVELAGGADGAYEYLPALNSDKDRIAELLEYSTYKDLYEHLGGVSFDRLSTKKMPDVSDESKAQSKDIREKTKKIITDLRDGVFNISPERIVATMAENAKIINILTDVLLLYDERLRAEKNRRKIIDFSDMEHYALQILLKKENGVYKPTTTALNYRKLYDEIMIDEYQDSNRIQELILSTISGEDDGIYNRFMVGDVKQSIYSFRRACPELFMEKYNTYTEDGKCIRIDLSSNYRSRSEVVDSVNYIFEQIMSKNFGEIEYDSAARLYAGASYPDTGEDNITELMLLQQDKESTADRHSQEAQMVADKIKSLVGVHKIYDKDADVVRPCSYRDIVILLRSNKGWDDKFKKVLEDNGIPTYITSKTGYFSSSEIKIMLNLLQVLDNPRSEIELYGVLTSIFGHFTVEEIAAIRAIDKCELYDMLCRINAGEYAENDLITDAIIEKIADFCAFLEEYRAKVIYTPINELLGEIIEKTGYMNYVGSLPLGEQRRANVYMLLEKAKQYESASFKGLYQFIRYIHEIQSYEVDFGEAIMLDENSDVVRIMSIHKSKGLEFPICFVSGMEKEYNFMDTNASIIYERDLGIGLDYIDTRLNAKYGDLRKSVLARKMRRDTAAEEMRVLYVALTRAKEKLILTSCLGDVDKRIEQSISLKALRDEAGKVLPYYIRSKADNYIDLVLAAIDTEKQDVIRTTILYPDDIDKEMIEGAVSRADRKRELIDGVEQCMQKSIGVAKEDCEKPAAEENGRAFESSDERVDNIINNVKNKITIKYMHKNLEDLYIKTSVSELKMAALHGKELTRDEEDTAHEMFPENNDSMYIPNFISTDESVKGTTRGTAYHRVMELLDFAAFGDYKTLDRISQKKKVVQEIKRMTESKLIDEENANLVEPEKIMTFLSSDLGARMCQADTRDELHVEEPFVLGVAANRLDAKFPEEERVLIQGIIDAFFYENGKIVLMDYKTDAVKKAQELVDRYKTQLDYYEEALTRITGIEVVERLIYSFALGETISC